MMKKIVLFVLLFAGITQAYSQDVRLGFQASPVFSWMTTNDNTIIGTGSNTGLKLGLIAENFFQENYAVTSGFGLVFNQGGTIKHQTGGNFFPKSDLSNPADSVLMGDIDISYNLQMLEIPLGIKLRTNEIGYLRYYGEIPFLLHVKTQARGAWKDTNRENITPDTGIVNVSWGLGGGVEYSISGETAAIAGVYFHNGLLDMTTNRNTQLLDDNNMLTDQQEDSKAIINAITIRLGVLF